ncbi:LOW QUALITY PROTEIN: melanoma-associated antigen B4-like [Erinaceus europaeus]|uniref:LOW QUALITY PROTEIN: melanoma-associated antigen B4-like n=2 Tax=Erinaceus europaeus TaxID=9365 RepID=A0ABM3WU32_ERIEU|nr:LOW QUALITY PROTEIN: melanoma-associated antigen B4-like [Erinaceus europaeus]
MKARNNFPETPSRPSDTWSWRGGCTGRPSLTSTVKVPKVLAKIDAVETTSFPNQYEEALGMRKTQQERDPQPRQLLLPQPVHLPGPRCLVSTETHQNSGDNLKKVNLLEQFLLYKFQLKQPILKAEMLKILGYRYQNRFLEMLKKASERIETLFAVRVQEVDSVTQAYDLVSELKLPNHGRVCPGRGLPKSGLLMHVLGMIFLKGNCASEEDIWRVLGTMQVFPGRKHNIYGEPRKLLTKDLVRLQYLEYRPVPNTQPPRYQFLWGPKAHAETSKMSVLQFMAKIKGTVPSSFSPQYQEALREQAERALARSLAGSRAKIWGIAGSRAKAQGTAGSRAKAQGAPGSSDKAQGAAGSSAKARALTESDTEYSSNQGRSFSEAMEMEAKLLEQFMLHSYQLKQHSMLEDMQRMVNPAFAAYFDDILMIASEHIETHFAMHVEEIDPVLHAYDLVTQLQLPYNSRVHPGCGLPKTGLLMYVLGLIFTKGSHATEEEIWAFLSMMSIYPGQKHHIYGEPHKLLTQDLVQLQYLEYHPVPHTQPRRYQFLGGPKAQAEIRKMRVLEFIAKVNGKEPTDYLAQYQEAVQDEQARTQAQVAARAACTSNTRMCPYAWAQPATTLVMSPGSL